MAVAEAIRGARETMTMIELGAGYGRWLVSGAQLARKINPNLKLKLVGIEADATHFGWMREHFEDNGINPAEHDLIKAAVAAESGTVHFCDSEDPSIDYGQHVSLGEDDPDRVATRAVEAIGINDLLRRYDKIDLVDMDIQGYERFIVPAGIKEMSNRVRRVYIGIHEPAEIETELTELFTNAGWTNLASFPFKSKVKTEFGPIEFIDGCQYWLNPRPDI
jgi:FkbM family methyltransferase